MAHSFRAAGTAAHHSIFVHDVTVRLPGGRVLLDALTHTFGAHRTGLVGRNGAGKSMLARVLAGLLAPDRGRVHATGSVHYLPQRIDAGAGSVAAVAGLGALFAASGRLAAGMADDDDFAQLDGRWSVPADFAAALAEAGLARLDPALPAAGLSGGQLARVALAGAFVSGADVLILDEPTNHLDGAGRAWLRDALARWAGPAIIVSHDRALLAEMDSIVELDEQGLHAYGGDYAFYAACKDAEDDAAHAALAQARSARQAGRRALRREHDAQQRQTARADRAGKHENQAAILLGRRRNTAQVTAGKQLRRADALRERLDDAVRDAAAAMTSPALPALLLEAAAVPAGRVVIACERAVAPFPVGAPPLDLTLAGPVRLAIVGPNGCGKSTLLKMLAGSVAPLSGTCTARVPYAWLDQHADALLPPHLSVLDQLRMGRNSSDSPLAEGDLRSRLALLGLDAPRAVTPAGALSGGERIKAALACALWRREPARLLLLDEPANHLDLPSLQALEAALRAWPGAFALVSHDTALLASLRLSHLLCWHPTGWRLETIS